MTNIVQLIATAYAINDGTLREIKNRDLDTAVYIRTKRKSPIKPTRGMKPNSFICSLL
jgi:hypothetical protein